MIYTLKITESDLDDISLGEMVYTIDKSTETLLSFAFDLEDDAGAMVVARYDLNVINDIEFPDLSGYTLIGE